MGGEQSYLGKLWSAIRWFTGWEDDQERDVIGLTSRQRKSIRQMWTEINKDKINVGIGIFVKLFTEYPEARQLFPALRKLTFDENFGKSPKLKAHSGRFMGLLSTCVENIEDPEVFEQLLVGLAASHFKLKVETSHFKALGPIMIETFSTHLGREFTSERGASWDIFQGYMFKIITTELQSIGEEQHHSE
ncbi:cytoglobin-2-like [Antedon mediterranea]|uniref:cytoglobin-2-like n=1 Tax=Antedon mediterranea TaxID=105859 RepID=UPI003AF612B3